MQTLEQNNQYQIIQEYSCDYNQTQLQTREICADTNQYIDFTTMQINEQDFFTKKDTMIVQMHAHGNST